MLVALLLVGPAAAAHGAERLRVAFRYDDYSAVSPFEVDAGVVAAFVDRGLPLTIGVVPAQRSREGAAVPFSPERIALLTSGRAAALVEIALHGYDHERAFEDRYPTEFDGIALDRQRQKIRSGTERLERVFGSRPTLFIPPWNTYDANTLRALEENGYAHVSGNLPFTPLAASDVVGIPVTSTLRRAETVLRSVSESGAPATVIVMFHPHDFAESGDDRAITSLAELAGLLDWITGLEDTRFTRVSEVPGPATPPAALRSLTQTVRLAKAALPAALRPRVHAIAPSEEIAALRARTFAWIAGFAGSLLLLGALPVVVLLRVLRPPGAVRVAVAAGLATLLAGASWHSLRDGDIGFGGVVPLVTCAGALLAALWLAFAGLGRPRERSESPADLTTLERSKP